MENSNAVWGALMVAYVVPWAIWMARRKDAGGEAYDKRTTRIGLCLTAGLGRTRRAQLVRLQQCGFDQLRRRLGLICHPLHQPLGQAQRHVYPAQAGWGRRASALVHFGHVAASHKPYARTLPPLRR